MMVMVLSIIPISLKLLAWFEHILKGVVTLIQKRTNNTQTFQNGGHFPFGLPGTFGFITLAIKTHAYTTLIIFCTDHIYWLFKLNILKLKTF